MLALFLRDVGRLDESMQALDVGAGHEPIMYWLANRLGRVVAVDIYGEGDFAGLEARRSVLEDPSAYAPYPYREDRLEVRWMDARRLDFPDESFDLVFTLSSIEHFGTPPEIARSAREIGRVLRPGGHAVIVTECFVRRHPLNAAPVDFAARVLTLGRRARRATPRRRARLAEVFTPRELMTRIVRPSRLRLLQPLDLTLSPESWGNVTRSLSDGRLAPASGQYSPHILLQSDRSVYTSVCLVLEKPAGALGGGPPA